MPLWRTSRQIGSGKFESEEAPAVRVEPFSIQNSNIDRNKIPLMTAEVDSKGHSIKKMRTTDPIDLIRTDHVIPEGQMASDSDQSEKMAWVGAEKANARSMKTQQEWENELLFEGGNNRLHLLRPFGPAIAEFLVPEHIFEKSRSVVDHVYRNEYQDYTQHLAGVVEEEAYIPAKYWFPSGLGKYFEDAVAGYLVEAIAASMMEGGWVDDSVIGAQDDSRPNIKTNSVWFNVMRANEYNPIHYHTNCQVSGVYYINVPDIPRRPEIKFGQDAMDGNILFIDNNNNPQTQFCMGHASKAPKNGMCYLFPSFMQHTVYPFRGDGERVSIAFNFTVEWGDKEIDPLVIAKYRTEHMPQGGTIKEDPMAALQNKRAQDKSLA